MQIQLEANSKEQQSFEQFDCNHHQSPVKQKKYSIVTGII